MNGASLSGAQEARPVRISGRSKLLAALLASLTFLLAFAVTATLPARADETASQIIGGDFAGAAPSIDPEERMLVESDQLVYDYDNNTVAAVGNVVIYYGGYTLEADRVSYDQTSGRLIATGAVKMTDPSGQTFRSEYFDITDDFADGFVRSLQVETADRTIFEAESAERRSDQTVFTNGAYSACVSCVSSGKPPFWKIKAKKIVIDHEEQVVRFTDASFEFFGTPVAWAPYFAIADPSVTRKSGLLAPRFGYSKKLGASISVPYFFALAPNYDLTVTTSGYTRQGVMGELEWRHRTAHGQYSVLAAGISQLDKDAFDPDSASYRDFRGGVRTTGLFTVGRDWTLGWDGTLSTDRTFTRDYDVLNGDTSVTTSTIYLEGLRDRNHFEARASHYQILSDPLPKTAETAIYDQGRQAVVVPVIDHEKIVDETVFGGEISYVSNLTALHREDDDPFDVDSATFYHGTAGKYVRSTHQLGWQKKAITPNGVVVKPFAYVRGDAFSLDSGTAATGDGMTTDGQAFRAMGAIGADVSYPILMTTDRATHIVEPRAQLIVRPDEMRAGELPNNDAQSLVFDDTNLFDHDKFSGYDRAEGGTRLNVGVHYNGKFANGASVHGTVGQSYHLAGTNPYAMPDLANVGPGSGLETNHSDYVAGATVNTGAGPRFHARGRFNYGDFSVKRAELGATAAFGAVTASTSYVYLSANPNTGVLTDSSVVRAAASMNLFENWRAFGTVTYDVNGAAIASDSIGIAYDDESATVSLAFSETRENYTDLSGDRRLNLRVQLRTIGETGISTDLNKLAN